MLVEWVAEFTEECLLCPTRERLWGADNLEGEKDIENRRTIQVNFLFIHFYLLLWLKFNLLSASLSWASCWLLVNEFGPSPWRAAGTDSVMSSEGQQRQDLSQSVTCGDGTPYMGLSRSGLPDSNSSSKFICLRSQTFMFALPQAGHGLADRI